MTANDTVAADFASLGDDFSEGLTLSSLLVARRLSDLLS